LTKVLNKDMQF